MRPQPEPRAKRKKKGPAVDVRQLQLALVELQEAEHKATACGSENLNLVCTLFLGHDGMHETASGLGWWKTSSSRRPSGGAISAAAYGVGAMQGKLGILQKIPTTVLRAGRSVVGIYAVTHRFEQSMWLCSACAKARGRRGEDVRWRGFLDPSFACDDCKRRSPRGKLTKR